MTASVLAGVANAMDTKGRGNDDVLFYSHAQCVFHGERLEILDRRSYCPIMTERLQNAQLSIESPVRVDLDISNRHGDNTVSFNAQPACPLQR